MSLLCGVPIDDLTLDEALDHVGEMVGRGRRTGRTHQVVTVNVDFLVSALADPAIMSLLQRADLAAADGMPVVWGSRLVGAPVRERVAGADLVPALAERCARSGRSMYLFGASEGVARRAAALLRQRHPGLRVEGDAGPMFATPEDMDPGVLDRIRSHDPDILCVALGHPKQERWIDLYREALGVPVLIGVGGSLDFLVGDKRRAPGWMQRTGTEWLHRAVQEPGRLAQRYARDLVRFGPRLAREVALSRSSGGARHDRGCLVERRGTTTVVRPRGRLRLDAATLGWDDDAWRRPGPDRHVVIDFAEQADLDHAELCALVGLARRLSDGGAELTLASVPPTLATTLLRMRLYGFLSTASGPAILPGVAPAPDRHLTNPVAPPPHKQVTHA